MKSGLSDWNVDELSFEKWLRDLELVVDATGLDRVPLLGISQGGGRIADRECRKLLGRQRQSSIFPPPSRATLGATSFVEACEIERANSSPPKKLNQQTFNLLPKIREVDRIAQSFRGSLFECHPEVCFWAMNGRRPMQLPKKASLRKHAAGVNGSGLGERSMLLLQNGYSEEFLATRLGSRQQYSSHDFVDACAAAWTAERLFKQQAIRVPSAPDFDQLGLDMAIWA